MLSIVLDIIFNRYEQTDEVPTFTDDTVVTGAWCGREKSCACLYHQAVLCFIMIKN